MVQLINIYQIYGFYTITGNKVNNKMNKLNNKFGMGES